MVGTYRLGKLAVDERTNCAGHGSCWNWIVYRVSMSGKEFFFFFFQRIRKDSTIPTKLNITKYKEFLNHGDTIQITHKMLTTKVLLLLCPLTCTL